MDPLQQLLSSSATKAYLDDGLKAGVVGAMGACLKAQPQNALAFIGGRLNATNPARKQSTMQLTIDGTTCTLTKDRLDKPQQRRYRHPTLPLVADMNPTRDELYKLVNIVRDVHSKQQAAAAAEIALQNGDQLPEMKDPAAHMAGAKRRVSIGKIEPTPSIESASSSRVKLLLVAPVDAEIIFVNGVPMVCDYRRVQARTAKEEAPEDDDVAAISGEGAPGGDGDDYSGIQRADSGPGTPQSPPIGIPRGNENVGDEPHSETTSEMDLSHTRVPAKFASPQKKRGGLTISQCEDLVALHAAKQPGINALPFRQMGDFVSSAFSTSGIHIEYSIVRTPDRYAVTPQLFDSIDEFVGLSDAAPIVPTIVAVFCPRPYLFRNVLSAVVSALAPIEQVASFGHNSALLNKRQVELKAREARNEAKLVNAAAYWAKVRARREHRDKLREQKATELLKRVPAPPLASNATDEERAAYDQKRKEEESARAAKERAYEEAAHRARVVRQARRSREDTAAAEVMRAQEHSSGTIINTVLRGYLVRRRLRNKLSDARARIAARQAEDESTEHVPLEMAMSVRSMRRAKRPHAKDELDCIRDCVSHPLEHKLVNDLLVAYNETLTFKPPAAKPPPRCYDNWVPRVTHIPASFDGEVSSDEEDWSREELTVAPILQTERYRLINPIGRLETVLATTHNALLRDIDVIIDEFGNVSPLQRQAYAMLHTKILHILHTVFLEVSHREMLPTGVVTFTEFVAHHTPQLDEWFAAPWEVASSLDTSIRAAQPTILSKSAVPSLLQRKTHFLVYDSGCFDPHSIHNVHRDSDDDDEPADDDRSARAGDDGDLVVTQVPGLLGSPARAESRNHDRTQSGGLNQSRSHADSRRTTSASAALPGTPSTTMVTDAHFFQRLQPSSPVFMAPDGAGLEVVKAALAPLVHAEAPTCVLWISLTAEPTVYVDRKPYFLARRFEHQDAPEYPKFANYAAVSRVISTNSDDKSPEKTMSRERRPSVGRISPVAGSLPPAHHHRQSTASSVGERSTTSIPDSTRSMRITPGSTAAAQEAAKRAAEATAAAVAKVPYTANDVPLTAIVTLASILGVSTLELEERLRAELLTAVDKAEGVMKFFAHRSLASADILVENTQTPGQYIVNDPYKHLAAMRANSTGSSPLGWSSPASSTVCSARSRECDRFDLLKTCIAVPKKEPPPRASVATTRGSMHYSMDQSFAFNASGTGGGTHSTSPTPRNAASRAASQAPQGPPPGSRSLRHRPSMASMASVKSDQNNEHVAAAATAAAEATGDNNRGSLQLPAPDPLPELEQLPSIVTTPQQAFDDILANHLPSHPQTRNFVRCPMPRFGGSDWLKRYSGFIRTVFDHLQAGIVGSPDSRPRTVIVTALSSPDDAIYAATAEIVSALMFERFDPLQKSPREAAAAHAQDPSMDAVFASVRMCAGTASTSMTPNTPRKNPLSHRSTVDVHDRAFGGLVALDVVDPTLMIGRAMKAVDAILKRAGLFDAVKGRVVRLRQSAEIQRGTACCRTAVRECCCALERYAFMVFATSLMQGQMRGLKANAEPECIDLFDAVTNTVAGESMEKFIAVADPWATATQLSPDPTHVEVYTKGPARWRELYFVDRALDRQPEQQKQSQ